VAAEQEEINRRARKAQERARRIAAEQVRAFQFGKAGKGQEMRRVVTESDLDVNKPQKLTFGEDNKKASKAGKEPKNFETMLHVVAASCDPEALGFLLNRGQSLF
jgi:hypothetical protein